MKKFILTIVILVASLLAADVVHYDNRVESGYAIQVNHPTCDACTNQTVFKPNYPGN